MGQGYSKVISEEMDGKAISKVMDGCSFNGIWTVIGAGGYGQVFKARHCQWGKDVAVKVLCNADALSTKVALDRESKLMLSYADSPYLMRTLGVFKGCRPGCGVIQVGLVMDLMEGGSLNSLQNERKCKPLPWALVFRVVHQVAEGMKHLHSLTPDAIIHKDLKPENILLDKDLNVKIIDFGIAKFANRVTTESLQGMSTSFYAPPESKQGGATTAYDVYSYAVLVWTILNPVYNDKYPFDVSKAVTSLEAVRRMEVPGLDDLVELMKSCWNQDPKERPTFADCTAVTERLYEMNKSGINAAVVQINYHVGQIKEEKDGVLIRKYPRRDFQRLTLDTNTTCSKLSLSENNRKVTYDGWGLDGQIHSYPDHHDRFDYWPQVLCSESLTGRCYWEVELSGRVEIAVTYRGISRKGRGYDRVLGGNDKSWRLDCGGFCYVVTHCNEDTYLPVSVSIVSTRDDEDVYSGRVAVYLDHPAGTLSFYKVSSDTLTHLHTFQTKFTEPLYAGFSVWWGGSVRLCEQR